MNNLIGEITSMTNLYWAWEKTKWFYKPGDVWFDEIEVASFEANLSNELNSIKNDILSNKYQLDNLKPVPFPKNKDKEGNTRTRQTFWVSVRDQVTWIAVVNIIGKFVDINMPFWSYGNRLFISTFYEENKETKKEELKFGYYRNTSKYTFRKWTQSWPLYRRHINLTSKFLSGTFNSEELDDLELETMNVNDSLKQNHPLKVNYINSEYWPSNGKKNLYWAGLDLEKFYLNIKLSLVKTNILTCCHSDDSNFEKLLDILFDFKLDLSGWDKEELKIIELDINNKRYSNIPTGLFVGGFLANVALLNIDKIVTEKLNKNKNIAHFRYVDDHVILANSFDSLLSWIQEYESILIKSEVFVGDPINPEKTEPSALGEYFKNIKDKPNSDIIEEYKKAEIECEIDPEFPSPLMTQTLSKVSKIAGTEFQLLDPEEQKGLISDIEHLLITEFPDNELRRDTRISFAASMLTSFVPKMTVDETKRYELTKKILRLKTSIKEEEKKKEKSKEQISELKKNLENLEAGLQLAINEISQEEKKIIHRTVKLLKKAVRENHQKVRLWARLVEFCYKSGGQIENEILDEVSKLLEDEESNVLSVSYIKSLILQVLNIQLINAFRILTNKNTLHKHRERANSFLEGLLNDKLLNGLLTPTNQPSKFYETRSIDTLKFTLGTILYLLENKKANEIIQKYNLIDWTNNPISFIKATAHDFESWVWWFTNKTLDFENNTPPDIWKISINKVDVFSEIGQAVISQFPKHLPEELIVKIDKNINSLIAFQNDSWQFDVYRGLIKSGIKIPAFLESFKNIENRYEDYVTLDEWIDWTREKQENIIYNIDNFFVFDPRLGEWMALEITKQIAQEIQSKTEVIIFETIFQISKRNDEISKEIHPRNFKISKNLLGDDIIPWDKLKTQLSVDKSKVSFIEEEYRLKDMRFVTPSNTEYLYSNIMESIITSLGSMLVCLLSKSLDLPSKINPIGHHFIWLEAMNLMLRKVAVSSYTRDLISGCFSKRNFETKRLINNNVFNDQFAENDFKKDPPKFVNLIDFIKYIKLSQEHLENLQISVSGNQPRQLIPISLIQMTASEYQKEIDNENN